MATRAVLFGRVSAAPGVSINVVPYGCKIERTRHAQRPRKRPTPLREGQTTLIEVHRCASPGQPTGGIRDHPETGRTRYRDHT